MEAVKGRLRSGIGTRRGGHWARPVAILLLSTLGFSTAAAQGTDPNVPPEQPLTCQVTNGGVLLEWSFVFFAPIDGYILSRSDGITIQLPPDATSYFDPQVPPGQYVYTLAAINFTGDIGLLATCEVVVPPEGLRCKAEENTVYLEWGPIFIDVLILEFRIYRNKELIATVPPDLVPNGAGPRRLFVFWNC